MRLKMYTSAMSSEFLRILMKRENEMMLYDAARGWKNHFVISLEQRVRGSSPARFTTSSTNLLNSNYLVCQLRSAQGQFGNIWEQNPCDSLDRTPLRVRNYVHVDV
jgi:hypothetical protein